MRLRLLATWICCCAFALVLAASALAADGGEGLYGKTDDKVITNFGFGLMIFFTLLVILLSVLQRALQKRKGK